MSTCTSIIQDALQAAGVRSGVVPTDPEQVENGFKRLRSLMQRWLSIGIELKLNPVTTSGEDLGESLDARNAIVDNLAISILQFYRMPASAELKMNALTGYEEIKALYQVVTIPNKKVSSTLPRGAGQSKGIDAKVFFGNNRDLGN